MSRSAAPGWASVDVVVVVEASLSEEEWRVCFVECSKAWECGRRGLVWFLRG